MALLGICCSCQSAAPVIQVTPDEEIRRLLKDPVSEQLPETAGYVMLPHRVSGDIGPECEGEGTTPQFLVDGAEPGERQLMQYLVAEKVDLRLQGRRGFSKDDATKMIAEGFGGR